MSLRPIIMVALVAWCHATALGQVVPREQEEFALELHTVPEGWPAVVTLLLVAVALWAVVTMYRRERRRGASPRVRWSLAAVRCLVLLLLALIWLEPVRARYLHHWIDSYTLVLVDTSASMDLTDVYREPDAATRVQEVMGDSGTPTARRLDLAAKLLGIGENEGLLTALTEQNRVRLYTFSSEPALRATIARSDEAATTSDRSSSRSGDGRGEGDRVSSGAVDDTTSGASTGFSPSSTEEAAANQPRKADSVSLDLSSLGATTNFARALRRSVEALGDAPLAAVVVLSDGIINEGEDATTLARYARSRGVAVHTVGIGDPSVPRNLRLAQLEAPATVFPGDPFTIEVEVQAEGAIPQTIPLELRARPADRERTEVVERRQVRITPDGPPTRVTFTHRQAQPGRWVYQVEAAAQGMESLLDDNRAQTVVQVLDGRVRVLIVAGQPSWDYRFVSRLLERDRTIDVSCWLQSADVAAVRDGNTIVDHLPRSAEELYAYDVIMLLDAQPSELDEEWADRVDTFVTEFGGGLLIAAARPYFPDFVRDPALGEIVDLLPVVPDPHAEFLLNELGHYQREGWPFVIPDDAIGHPVMALGSDSATTQQLWASLGPWRDVYWHYPVVRAKPVATVLMTQGHPRFRQAEEEAVLAAVQYVGAGRTAFLGIDGTWRWRRGSPAVFDRFWIQMVRFLVEGKQLGGTKRARLVTDADRFPLGEAVTVRARLLDPQYEPWRRDEVDARYEVEGVSQKFTLRAVLDDPGWFEGRFVPDRVGAYRVRVALAGAGGGPSVEAYHEVQVARSQLETAETRMNREALRTLATGSAGGRYFEVNEVEALPELIPDRHEETVTPGRPSALWDNATALALLAGLLCVEWAVRKWKLLL
jgi:hypothetical protein